MALNSELTAQGNWLFRYRSYLPVSILPLLFYLIYIKGIGSYDNLLLFLGIIITFAGELVRILTVGFTPEGTSGRNIKQQLAESLNTTGIYSMLRHPLYVGNYLMFLGPFIYTGHVWGIILFSLIFWIYYERIMIAEESFLRNKFGDNFTDWAQKTPAVIPTFANYTPNERSFSLIKILLAEYSGMCAVIPIFTLLLLFQNFLNDLSPLISESWKILFGVNVMVYIVLRSIKKIKRARQKT